MEILSCTENRVDVLSASLSHVRFRRGHCRAGALSAPGAPRAADAPSLAAVSRRLRRFFSEAVLHTVQYSVSCRACASQAWIKSAAKRSGALTLPPRSHHARRTNVPSRSRTTSSLARSVCSAQRSPVSVRPATTSPSALASRPPGLPSRAPTSTRSARGPVRARASHKRARSGDDAAAAEAAQRGSSGGGG